MPENGNQSKELVRIPAFDVCSLYGSILVQVNPIASGEKFFFQTAIYICKDAIVRSSKFQDHMTVHGFCGRMTFLFIEAKHGDASVTHVRVISTQTR